MRINARLVWRLLAGFVIALLAAAAILPIAPESAIKGPMTRSLSNAKQIAIACKLYAMDNDGHYPVNLSELEPNYLTDLKDWRGIVNGPDNRPAYYDWLYFGAGFTTAHPPKAFLASPQTGKNGKRVIINGELGGTAMAGDVIKEDEYEKALAETVRQMRALDDASQTVETASDGSMTKGTPAK